MRSQSWSQLCFLFILFFSLVWFWFGQTGLVSILGHAAFPSALLLTGTDSPASVALTANASCCCHSSSTPPAGKRPADACVHTDRILQSKLVMTRLKNLYSNAPGSLMQPLVMWLQHSPLLERNISSLLERAAETEHRNLFHTSLNKLPTR